MKKKTLLRCVLGIPIGLALGYMITIILSLIIGDGSYYPCVPSLVTVMDSEMSAVLLQAILCGVLGAGFAGASVIWEIEDWGLVKQTAIYFVIISIIMLPIAYISHWMEHSLKGVLSYMGIFAGIFVVMWVVQYAIARNNVKKMNETLGKR